MLKDLILVGLDAVFGLGAALMTLAAPLYFPNAPHWIWHSLFWGGIVLMILMIADAAIMLLFESAIQAGTAVFGNISLFTLALAIIWQTYHPPEIHKFPVNSELPAESMLAEISHEQYVVLNEMAIYFSRNESQLDDDLDFFQMMGFTILWYKRQFFPQSDNSEYDKLLQDHFKDGPLRFSSKYLKTHQQPGGTVIFAPNGIFTIVTSLKYVEARERIKRYTASYLIPDAVKTALDDFNKTLDENEALLLDLLNERFTNNKQNFLWEVDQKNPYFGNISYAYRHQFKPLKPPADKIVAAIRASLHIK